MVKDVLELNRRDRVQAEPIRLTPFLGAFLDEFAQNEQIDRRSFVLEIGGDGVVEFDRVHLHQVLWNLVRNAVAPLAEASGERPSAASAAGQSTRIARGRRRPGRGEGSAEPAVRAVLHDLQRGHRPRPVHRTRAVRGERRDARLRRPAGRARDFRITWLGVRR